MSLSTIRIIEQEILEILEEKLALRVPSSTTDLLETGILDSLLLAELLSLLEVELAVRVPVEHLDLDEIRTVHGIACVVARELRDAEAGEGEGHGDAATLH